MATTDKTNILERLAQGITQHPRSERWQDWLASQSRFHSYSFNNTPWRLGGERTIQPSSGRHGWLFLVRRLQLLQARRVIA